MPKFGKSARELFHVCASPHALYLIYISAQAGEVSASYIPAARRPAGGLRSVYVGDGGHGWGDEGELERFGFPLHLLGQIAVTTTVEVGYALADKLESTGVIKHVHCIDVGDAEVGGNLSLST